MESTEADLEGNVELAINKSNQMTAGFGSRPIETPREDLGFQASTLNLIKQNTLDEPVFKTLKRDLLMICFKLKYVLNPRTKADGVKTLRNWDLWGPLMLCLLLAFVLSIKAGPNSPEMIFGTVFIIIWIGAIILTINAQLLGGKMSFFQSVCVLGYCIFPINIAASILTIIETFTETPTVVAFLVCGLGMFWSTRSSIGFIKALVSEEKKLLAAYPVLLFYLFLSWFVLITSDEYQQ